MSGSSGYKMTFGRKFWAGIFGILIMLTVYVLALVFVPMSVTSAVIMLLLTLVVTVVFMYIGGNVWNKWVKSKYFQADILNGRDK